MKNIKHLTLLLAAALITVMTYAQTDGKSPSPLSKGGATAQILKNQKPLKMQSPTKMPAASKPIQPAKPAAGTK